MKTPPLNRTQFQIIEIEGFKYSVYYNYQKSSDGEGNAVSGYDFIPEFINGMGCDLDIFIDSFMEKVEAKIREIDFSEEHKEFEHNLN